jgi:hypothetical protein
MNTTKTNHDRFFAAALLLLGSALLGVSSPAVAQTKNTPRVDEPIRLNGTQLEPFVDRYLIERMEGVELRLNHPVDMGPVIEFDAPWEGRYVGYVTVIKDGPVYRMYYRGKPTPKPSGAADETTCYAESTDGIRWKKPELGLFEVNGSRKNNVILDPSFAPIACNFSPLLDTRPGVPQEERYKALGGEFSSIRSDIGLIALISPDGIHWKKRSETAVISGKNYPTGTDPSLDPAFWSETEQCYVAHVRTRSSIDEVEKARAEPGRKVPPVRRGNMRWIGRTTSPDFVHWSNVEMMDYVSPPGEQIYNNATSPYFRAPHIYLGLAARIMFGRRVVTAEQAAEIGVDPDHAGDCSEPVLLTSRGGTRYERSFLEPLIRNGLGPADWTSRNNYPALNIVPTGPREMSLYVQKGYAQKSPCLHRYRLETDRLASVHAPFAGGEFVTKPLVFSGKNLVVNFATSVAGSVRVEMQTAAGEPIPGYSLDDSVELVGNELERVVAWKRGSDVISIAAGAPVRLRFVMREADVYSLRFVP